MAWISLSYVLDETTFSYGNGGGPQFEPLNAISNGDSANVTAIRTHSHIGTHVDFPKHFLDDAATGDTYATDRFVFNQPACIDIEEGCAMVTISELEKGMVDIELSSETDFLIMRTGLWKCRNDDRFWNDYPGIAAETAAWLRERLPSLKAIGLDTISLSSWNNRAEGRISHREYLGRDIWIVEDMDLSAVSAQTQFRQLILAPMLFRKCDGAPSFILADVKPAG